MDGEQLGMIIKNHLQDGSHSTLPSEEQFRVICGPTIPSLSQWDVERDLAFTEQLTPQSILHLCLLPTFQVSPSVFFSFSLQRHKQCWLGFVVVVGGVWEVWWCSFVWILEVWGVCFFKMPHCFQLLIPHWLENYYHLFLTISTETNIIWVLWLQVENKHHKFMQCHLLQTKTRDKETEIVTCETLVSKQNTCQRFFMKYYCILLTINMSVQHRKLPAEHDALSIHKSDCVADVKCKIH